MTWVIRFDAEKRLVVVNASGALESSRLRQMTLEVKELILGNNARGALIDYREAVSRLQPYEIFERPKILQELGFPANARVAVLYRALDENTQFLENVYRNKNYAVRVFEDEGQALSWLES